MKAFQSCRGGLQPLRQTFFKTNPSQRIRPSPIPNHITNTARRKPVRSSSYPHRPYSTKPNKPSYNPTPHLNSPTPSLSLSQRLRKLSREYGWSAFGVYFLLSALDFPFCFAAVTYLGVERIGHYEHVVVKWVKSVVPESAMERWKEMRQEMKKGTEEGGETGVGHVGGLVGKETKVEGYGVPASGTDVAVVSGYDHGVKEAEELNRSDNASQYSHDAFLFSRHRKKRMLTRENRYLDATSFGLCHSQVIHLHQSTTHRCCYTKSGQSAQRLGLGHWEAEAKRGKLSPEDLP